MKILKSATLVLIVMGLSYLLNTRDYRDTEILKALVVIAFIAVSDLVDNLFRNNGLE